MTIEILPARLANQIAAGEVVERPASVIKELVENSLDAGATQIHIDVDKGGTKKLRVADNGSGIVQSELTLALSRHATSKIKNLDDLEGISSLGFRGEALASISAVSRLTLTSKPIDQETAWQASAQGRDMEVTVQPAAHPNGTTIEVLDLFFNTPARRKFLRTEKTEFTHIDEVVRRIALARFDVTFTLTHNGKVMRQYKAATNAAQFEKRVAMVCGKAFIEQAIKVDCQHDNIHLSGWLAKPSFYRSQNDLSYSYVNGRMMRDKLINHAIRQSYAAQLQGEQYPAFVLFLSLDYREVDVNVHPSKHEVRFHQGRYVHDFIYSVCHNALMAEIPSLPTHHENNTTTDATSSNVANAAGTSIFAQQGTQQQNSQQLGIEQQGILHENIEHQGIRQQYEQREQYVQPLAQVTESASNTYQASTHSTNSYVKNNPPSSSAKQAYQQLITPYEGETSITAEQSLLVKECALPVYQFIEPGYMAVTINKQLRLVSLFKLAAAVYFEEVKKRHVLGMVSQPLLLPVILSLAKNEVSFITQQLNAFEKIGIVIVIKDNKKIQIRQFPAYLRHQNVTASFNVILQKIMVWDNKEALNDNHWCQALANAMVAEHYTQETAEKLIQQSQNIFNDKLEQQFLLNSAVIDLTLVIEELT